MTTKIYQVPAGRVTITPRTNGGKPIVRLFPKWCAALSLEVTRECAAEGFRKIKGQVRRIA